MRDFDLYRNRLLDLLLRKGRTFAVMKGELSRCISPNHEDKNPSCLIKNDKFHCFACGVQGDIYDAIGLMENISDRKAQFDAVKKYLTEGDHA